MIGKLITQSTPLPNGAEVIGYVQRHPADKHGLGGAILRMPTGIEVFWTGASVRSVPNDWRDRVYWEAAGGDE